MKKIDLSLVNNGIVCFTYDDRNFEGWIRALPIFEKYNAHASFFISGAIDESTLSVMKKLKEKGHTVGLHTLNHVDAPEFFEQNNEKEYFQNEIYPQLSVCIEKGYDINSFAYPNNCRSEKTDEFLKKYFNKFRAGRGNYSEEEMLVSVYDLKNEQVMRGFGIGQYYNTTENEVLDKIRHVALSNTCVTFFSHDIKPNAEYINMPLELLDKSLKLAEDLGVKVIGFDEF